MGTLVAKHYPTTLALKAADHTYVACGTGRAAWSCWGGKTDGKVLRKGTGSTKRADKIAGSDEKAGIKCYLINGVCHQAANRILLPAGITVRGARGYGVSEALYGTYGRLGIWPCRAPFNQHQGTTGDLPACIETRKGEASALTLENKCEWRYLQSVLSIYEEATHLMKARRLSAMSEVVSAFHMKLFLNMAEFNLGPTLDDRLERKLTAIRESTEKRRAKTENAYARDELDANAFAATVDDVAIKFQDEMANALKPEQYESLLGLPPGETITLADPFIVEQLSDR